MRTDEEIRANQAKYERMLDEAFGLVPTQEPQAPAQPATSEPMPYVMPYGDVYGLLTGDPEAASIFRQGWADTFKPVDIGPMPPEASAQLRWYHMRDLAHRHNTRHKADFEDARKFRTAQRVNTLFAKLKQHDPLFELTSDMMEFHVRNLPGSARRAVERMLTRCPHEALDFYREVREAAETYLKHYRNKTSSSR